MNNLATHAAWVMFSAFAISCVYEIYRATVMKGTSRYDSPRVFLTIGIPFYVVSFCVSALLFAGYYWANLLALGYTIVLIGVGIFFYSPKISIQRKPRLIDWIENLLYLGLLFSAATILLYSIFLE